jgi:hypothetical protein
MLSGAARLQARRALSMLVAALLPAVAVLRPVRLLASTHARGVAPTHVGGRSSGPRFPVSWIVARTPAAVPHVVRDPERRSSIRSEGEPPQAGDLAAGNSSDRHWPRSAGHFATHATKLRVLRVRPLAQRVGTPDAPDRGGHRSPMSHLTKGRSSDG